MVDDKPGASLAETYWTIGAEHLMSVMERAHAGEHPDMLYVELIANSTQDDIT